MGGQHPIPVGVIQHLRSPGPARFRSDGKPLRCEIVRAVSDAHPICGPSPRLKCAGADTFDSLVSLFLQSIHSCDRWTAAPLQQPRDQPEAAEQP